MTGSTIGHDFYRIIGDPDFVRWLTAAAYFLAAFLAWRLARGLAEDEPERTGHARRFWRVFAAFLCFLGFCKQLELQAWMIAAARNLARQEGWYDRRQIVQIIFIALVILLGAAIFCWFIWLSRRAYREHWLALAGGIYLICFIMIRACSFHQVDRLMGLEWDGFQMSWALELGGILWVGACAAQNLIARALGRARRQRELAGEPGK